jgi:hypothetical protein
MLTTTFKNNNPGNLRWNSKFKGVVGKSKNGFAIFSSKYAGLAAMENLLKNYIKKGFNTLEKILYRYAPPTDNNNTEAYIQFVSQRSGIVRNAILKADQVASFIPAMVKMETGKELGKLDLFLSKNWEKMPIVILASLLLFKKLF